MILLNMSNSLVQLKRTFTYDKQVVVDGSAVWDVGFSHKW